MMPMPEPRLRLALLVVPPDDCRPDCSAGLAQAGARLIARTTTDAPRDFPKESAPELAVIDVPEIDPAVLAATRLLFTTLAIPVGVLTLRADLTRMTEALAAGAAAVQIATDRVAALPTLLLTAQAQFRHRQGLLDALAKARMALSERKTLDRAKGLIMAHLGCSEEAAYQRIRKLAMVRNLRISEAAEQLYNALVSLK
jgi:response regulator NasT